MSFINKLINYHKACYPSLFVTTHEEARLIREIIAIRDKHPEVTVNEWDVQNGLRYKSGPIEVFHPDVTKGVTELLQYIQAYKHGDTIFILKDFHLHFDNKLTIRMLRNACNLLKRNRNMIVFVGHKYVVPGELQKEVQLLDYDLPDAESIKERVHFIKDSVNKELEAAGKPLIDVDNHIIEGTIEAAKGMTAHEVENALALAFTSVGKFDNVFVECVFQEKIAQLKKSGLLTYMEPNISFDNVGGMQGLKNWLNTRKKAYSRDAREYNLPLPKGMLLASVPGAGKSLICKAIAKEFDCPLFSLDIGSVFDSLVGNSEKNMREMIKTIESIGKCVILIDEIEKALNSSAVSGAGDSGVSSRIFGTLLTWLNDRNNPAFIVATTNNHTLLPSALIRKGRFDQLFWVDLPTAEERREIFNVVIKKYNRNPQNFSIKTLVNGAEGFTGAEIEEVFKDALYKAFDADEDVHDGHIMEVLAEFIPFSVSHEEDLKTMRRQAQGKLVMVTSKGDPIADVEKNMRKLSIAIGNEE
jgi:AAA+ superfamily predicted ATPase